MKGGGGQHAFKIREMHDQYGPVIRINPREVHIDGRADPAFWDILYSHSNKLDKDSAYYDGFGAGLSAVSTGPADLHRARRGAMANYFSMNNIRKYEPMVLEQISKLFARLEKCKTNDEVVDLGNAYRCLTTDVITSFAIPEPRTMLDLLDFGKDFNRLLRDFAKLITFQRHLKIVFPLLSAIPDWLTIRMDKTGASLQMVDFQRSYERQTQLAIDRKGNLAADQSPSILDSLATSSELKDRDKLAPRIIEEARNTVGAGTETTASTLTTLTFHLLSNPPILVKLKKELSSANPSSSTDELLDYRTLDPLPYLNACISESLRLTNPVTGRLPRINPRAATTCTTLSGTTYVFPPGTVMSMSMPDMHSNPSIFPSPSSFKPERWLKCTDEEKAGMQQAFVPFGRGSRACIGMELARMEVLLMAGNLFGRFGMELWETREEDVGWRHDFFAPFGPADSKGLRVKVV
ncbi:uncharacterized protein LTR77_002327 [Saxophila tyrrhenica]|uniref:Cytochrome P450 n=1 Tax=Saxophila tyrrhenica TaxID=1690608 RepID=A0AAV9PK07_9PEZI|nr:hypothetical protein LTR77_002327 [Saxophila tyrrhenica]